MAKYSIPYGSEKLEFTIQADVEVDVIKPGEVKCSLDCVQSLNDALDNPINSKPFSEIISEKTKKYVLVIDDYTRKFPNKLIIPPILERFHEKGIPKENITFLMGCGTHKEPNKEHLKKMFHDNNGKNILEGFRLIWNNIEKSEFKNLGTTSRGTPIEINIEYLNADVKILLADIQFHYYAGFGGGRKCILPGVSSNLTIDRNHSFLTDPLARTGNLDDNPVHLDMKEAAEMVGADFVINVVTSIEGEVIDIRAGSLNDAFLEATKIFEDNYKITLNSKADMLILSAGGYPKDINLYQGLKGLEHCRSAVKEGGIIFYFAECKEGIGNKVFDEWMDEYNTFNKIKAQLETSFVMGGHKVYYLLSAIKQVKDLYMLSKLPAELVEKKFLVIPIKNKASLEGIINKSINENNVKKIYIIPNGGDILIDVKE